ncbi:MAG: hypothetical protein AB1705_02375 [Verrucomicrobiota bacterium]
MKLNVPVFCLSAAVAAAALVGCSKKKEEAAKPASSSDKKESKPSSPPVDLTLKWEPAKKYSFRQESAWEVETRVSAGQAQQSTKVEVADSQDFALTVVGERPNGAGHEVELEFISRKVEAKVAGMTNIPSTVARTLPTFDSAQPKSRDMSPVAKAYRKLVGVKVGLLTDAAGKIDGVKDYAGFLKKITYGSSPASPEVALLKVAFTEANLKNMDLLPLAAPSKPVREGDSWKTPAQVSLANAGMGILPTELTVTFKGYEERDGKKLAKLETQAALVRPGTAAPAAAPAASETPDESASADPQNASRLKQMREQEAAMAADSGEPAPAKSEAPSSDSSAAPATVPGQIGTVTGQVLYDPELRMIVEAAQTTKISVESPAAQGRTVTRQITVTTTNKLLDSDAKPAAAPKAEEPAKAAK